MRVVSSVEIVKDPKISLKPLKLVFDCDDEVANRTLELNVKFQVYEWCRICWELFQVLESFGSHLRSSEGLGAILCPRTSRILLLNHFLQGFFPVSKRVHSIL